MNGLIQLLNNCGVPQGVIIQATFYLVAVSTGFFALRVVSSRNVFHSAIFLALTLMGVACVFLYLDAEFLAFIQILVYVGAIVVLIIFAIMFTTKIHDRSIKQTNEQVLISVVVSLTLLYLFTTIIRRNPWQAGTPQAAVLSLSQLGTHLMTTYALAFEVISLILLAALIAALVIGKVKKE